MMPCITLFINLLLDLPPLNILPKFYICIHSEKKNYECMILYRMLLSSLILQMCAVENEFFNVFYLGLYKWNSNTIHCVFS